MQKENNYSHSHSHSLTWPDCRKECEDLVPAAERAEGGRVEQDTVAVQDRVVVQVDIVVVVDTVVVEVDIGDCRLSTNKRERL